MVKYYFEGDKFIIEDYQRAKTFSSFLPAIAGEKGKPMWVFFANVGECVGGFGVDSRHTPITPFDSATLAYQNIPLKGFRTFISASGRFYKPFSTDLSSQKMEIDKSNFTIEERQDPYILRINYNTISNQPFAALVRTVTITNPSKEKIEYDYLDGLPVFFPYGLDNNDYKELVSLMQAYCQIHNLEENAPFVKFKTSTGDNPVVKERVEGNGFYSFKVVNGKRVPLHAIIDPSIIFKRDTTLINPVGFFSNRYSDFIKECQQTENILPCAFNSDSFTLGPGESITFYTLYGSFKSIEDFNMYIVNNEDLVNIILVDDTTSIINDLLSNVEVHTANPIFDNYIKETYLDNGLRGGFPVMIESQPYYIYGRRHGDMERDYNFFIIPSSYYSSGSGNYRDINQNRRNDLYYAPFLEDYNVFTFFNLIQVDGQNPLTVKPNSLSINTDYDLSSFNKYPFKDELIKLVHHYEPSSLYTYLDSVGHLELFNEIMSHSFQASEGAFSEGYWVDHWTYNVDLLENYKAIYPDKMHKLLFTNKYRYFYSLVYVEPRSEKYCLLPDGNVRQYGAINLNKTKNEAQEKGFDMDATHYLTSKDGKEIWTNLASKIFNLILIKFSTLDSDQLGIEMECEKPGWNDAMNGLPGLFGSSLNETVELLRLVRFLEAAFKEEHNEKEIVVLKEQATLYKEVTSNLRKLNKKEISQFDYWDKVTSAREKFRNMVHYNASGVTKAISISSVFSFLKAIDKLLVSAINKAKEIGKGILPSYLIHTVTSYEETGMKTHLGYPSVKVTGFKTETIPPFLEASARMFKLGKRIAKKSDIDNIKKSDLYDKKLHMYKTCADIENAPFEIGRVHAFTKGWLERECNFLHMTYKYLLGLLKAGYYEEFFKESKTNFTCYMNPSVYGRSPIENVSFIVPSCNPDESRHGRGYFARLTGANAELLNMMNIIFIGETPFTYLDNALIFKLSPHIPSSYFDEGNISSYKLFSKTVITYHNPNRLETYKGVKLLYKIEGKEYKDEVKGETAERIRKGEIEKIDVEVISYE